MGPLIDKGAVDMVQHSIQRLKDEGGEILYGGERLDGATISGRLLHDAVPGECEARISRLSAMKRSDRCSI